MSERAPLYFPRTDASRAAWKALRAQQVPIEKYSPLLELLDRSPRNHLRLVHEFCDVLGSSLSGTYSWLVQQHVLPTPACTVCKRVLEGGLVFRFVLSAKGTLALCEPFCRTDPWTMPPKFRDGGSGTTKNAS